MSEELFNVVAVRLDNGARRVIAECRDRRNAEAIVEMAVMRRGVDEEYFTTVPASQSSR